MSIDLKQNYFDLFGLSVCFDLDKAKLSTAFRAVQSKVHPDKFVNASEQDSRLAVQITAHINEAYNTLRNTRLRARYLLELQGVEFNDELDVSRDTKYLTSQLELRESISDVSTIEDANEGLELLDVLSKQVKNRQRLLEKSFSEAYANQAWDDAKAAVIKMRFCERIQNEISIIEEQLEDRM